MSPLPVAQALARAACPIDMGNTAAQPQGLRTPLFDGIVERLRNGDRWVVLDLGPARAENVGFFSGYRCRLSIADLGSDVETLDALIGDVSALEARVRHLLPEHPVHPPGLVLCWDLFNYLAPAAWKAVAARIRQCARPGTLVHGLLVYSAANLPVAPAPWIIQADGSLYRQTMAATREAARCNMNEIKRLMPGFSAERSVLLRNGMLDCLWKVTAGDD